MNSAGRHCFDETHPVYQRIRAMLAVRAALPVLRHGRQYLRPLSILGAPFAASGAGEILAWSRILDDEEALCVVNTHGEHRRGADVLVDATMNEVGCAFRVAINTAHAVEPSYEGTHPLGSALATQTRDGLRFLEIRDLGPSEVLVLVNRR